MRRILLIGAGRSSSSLIDYLLGKASAENWTLTVGDVSEEFALSKRPAALSKAIRFDINNEEQTRVEVERADLVISMLPAHMHMPLARICVGLGKNLVTASYVSADMQSLHEEAVRKGVILLNECGLDPGIDHMSAMEVIRAIRREGGRLKAFYSYTGGLVAPESNDNPWGYKFSWNPRNVILAGQGTARYVESGRYRYIPYQRLFKQITQVEVDGVGRFDGYANRDSLAYRRIYDIENIPTLLRGTLRQEGYCASWQVFVTLGLTDDTYVIENSGSLTYAQLVEALLPDRREGESLRTAVARLAGLKEDGEEMARVAWTGIFDDRPVGLEKATPAQILQKLLEEKWKLRDGDKDMIVMQHRFIYELNGESFTRFSSLVVIGDDSIHTAMAKTVGLPVAIAAKNILNGSIRGKGVVVPVEEEICIPVLRELEEFGIRFTEKVEKST